MSSNGRKLKKFFDPLPPPRPRGGGEASGGSGKRWFLGFGPLRTTFAKDTFSFEEPFYEKRSRRRTEEQNRKENNDGNSGPLTSLPVDRLNGDRLQRRRSCQNLGLRLVQSVPSNTRIKNTAKRNTRPLNGRSVNVANRGGGGWGKFFFNSPLNFKVFFILKVIFIFEVIFIFQVVFIFEVVFIF